MVELVGFIIAVVGGVVVSKIATRNVKETQTEAAVYISINTVGILIAESMFRIVILTIHGSLPLAALSALIVLIFFIFLNQILQEIFESRYATDRKL